VGKFAIFQAQEIFNKLSHLGVFISGQFCVCTSHIAELKPGGLFQKMGDLQELNSSLLFSLSSYKVGLSKKQPKAKTLPCG
jgi:hypothetical protein